MNGFGNEGEEYQMSPVRLSLSLYMDVWTLTTAGDGSFLKKGFTKVLWILLRKLRLKRLDI